jgi:hypothetical protein
VQYLYLKMYQHGQYIHLKMYQAQASSTYICRCTTRAVAIFVFFVKPPSFNASLEFDQKYRNSFLFCNKSVALRGETRKTMAINIRKTPCCLTSSVSMEYSNTYACSLKTLFRYATQKSCYLKKSSFCR